MRHAVAATGTVSGSAVEPGRDRRPGAASPCHRGGDLGHARGQLRADASSDGQARRGGQPGRVLVAAGQLEEPDAHTQPRHHLLHAVLRHQRRRAGGAGDTACRHRHDRRLDRRLLADGDRRRRTSGRRQGSGRQVPHPAARPRGRRSRRLSSRVRRPHISPMRCCGRTIAVPPTPISPTRLHTGNAFGCIRFRLRPIRRRPRTSTRTTHCSTRRSPTMRGSSTH